jgi:hypothetical protein
MAELNAGFERLLDTKDESWANGREARTLIEQAMRAHAFRLRVAAGKPSRRELRELTPEDMRAAFSAFATERKAAAVTTRGR